MTSEIFRKVNAWVNYAKKKKLPRLLLTMHPHFCRRVYRFPVLRHAQNQVYDAATGSSTLQRKLPIHMRCPNGSHCVQVLKTQLLLNHAPSRHLRRKAKRRYIVKCARYYRRHHVPHLSPQHEVWHVLTTHTHTCEGEPGHTWYRRTNCVANYRRLWVFLWTSLIKNAMCFSSRYCTVEYLPCNIYEDNGYYMVNIRLCMYVNNGYYDNNN